MNFLDVDVIIDLHEKLIDQFGGRSGIRDQGLLDSALSYPQLLYAIGMERDKYVLAAAYGYHLIKNHPFVDGNKRIGTLAMLTFLRINGISILIGPETLYDLAVRIALSRIDEQVVALELIRLNNN